MFFITLNILLRKIKKFNLVLFKKKINFLNKIKNKTNR